ncbi:hypothetical protein pb186bvf_016281 [Paramecium bursaria]
MTFEIKSYDFDRDDGLVEVVIKLKRLHSLKPAKKTNDNLVVKKVKASKIDVQILKNILKNPLTIDNVRQFYRIYGYKLIQMDFGQFEMFNIKRQTFQRQKEGIRRWGQYFQLGTNTFEQIFDSFNFLTILFREILYSQRVSLCCQNDNKRKYEYPFKSLMVFDPIDTLEFSLFQLSDLTKKSGQQYNELIKMKLDQFQSVTGNSIAGESLNIIVPFLYVIKMDDQLNTFLVIASLIRQNKSQAFELKIEITTKLRQELDYRNLIYDYLQSVFNNIKRPLVPMTFIQNKHVPKDQIQHFIDVLEIKLLEIHGKNTQSYQESKIIKLNFRSRNSISISV